jgi:hypothetical protein
VILSPVFEDGFKGASAANSGVMQARLEGWEVAALLGNGHDGRADLGLGAGALIARLVRQQNRRGLPLLAVVVAASRS